MTFSFDHTIMFEPIRGGTRGGQAEFKWSDVSADKDREVCVFPPVPLIGSTSPALYRITWAIALTPQQAGGRKIRTFIGTIATYKQHQTSVRRKFVKSRKQRRRPSPLHCMTFFFCPCWLFTATYSAVSGHPRRNHHQAH